MKPALAPSGNLLRPTELLRRFRDSTAYAMSNCQYLWIRYLVDHVSLATSSTSKPSVLVR